MKKSVLYIIITVLSLLILFLLARPYIAKMLDNGSSSNGSDNSDNSSSNGSSSEKTGSVSGTIEYSGLKPQEGDEGYIYFEYREHDKGDFQTLKDKKAPLKDGYEWKLDGVPTDVTYDARAVLVVGTDDVITKSNTITVTAPAQDEVFEFNVTYDMLPDYALQTNPVNLGGYVIVNGFIPSGSTLTMFAKQKDKNEDFTAVAKNVPVNGQKTDWNWKDALPGRTYELKTEVYNSVGTVYASSFVGEKAAPSDNAYFVLDSRAEDPNDAKNKVISGTVKINGNFNSSSKVHIKVRVSGSGDYKTVTTVNPSNDSVNWQWNEAVSGTRYDVKPFIVQSGKDDIRGSAVSVTAPATGVKLVIDTKNNPKAPEHKPELESCKNIEGNKYQAKLKFKNIDGADKYWLIVGKSSGAMDVSDSIVNNSGSTDPTLVVNINKDQNYYSGYAYTKCEDCDGKSAYSAFSESLKFSCN